MKKLAKFLRFDYDGFAREKVFMVIGCSPWRDFDTNEILGTKVDTVIVKDGTNYGNDDEPVNNLYEKLPFKIQKIVNVPIKAIVKPVNPIASVYGEFRNNLSVTAEDIQIIKQ